MPGKANLTLLSVVPGSSTMSAQARYTTLLKNVTSIYAAASEQRTVFLHTGLNEIVNGISPVGPADWAKVRADSEILLRIWSTKENDNAALEVLNQLLNFLELQASAVTAVPTLHISDKPETKDKILHIKEISYEEDEEEEEEEDDVVPAIPVSTKIVVVKAQEEKVEEEVEEEEEEEEEEVEEEVEEEEVEEEEEEVEEEVEVEEEEEADGMEVEQVNIRGRTYWIDTNSKKLYANAAGDEVGDEVGAMVNGKPVFLAAK